MHCILFGYGEVPSGFGKGIDFPLMHIGVRNDNDFHNFVMMNGTAFKDFGIKQKVSYTFSKNWYKVGYPSSEKNGIRNGYLFEASMARPRPKFAQVYPSQHVAFG